MYHRDELPPGDGYVAVDDGNRNACALHESGRIDCWGDNTSGQDQVPDGTWVDVAAGETVACGRRTDGSVECRGCGGECPTTHPNLP